MKDLIERLERANGPTSELEREIMYAVFGIPPEHRSQGDKPHPYTVSLDAAVRLVPEGKAWTLGKNVHHGYWQASVNDLTADGEPFCLGCSPATSSPARALCIAALRAHVALQR